MVLLGRCKEVGFEMGLVLGGRGGASSRGGRGGGFLGGSGRTFSLSCSVAVGDCRHLFLGEVRRLWRSSERGPDLLWLGGAKTW